MAHSKKYSQARDKIEQRRYQLREAIDLIREIRYAKFDETLEIAIRLGVDPRHADQMVRGTVVLPHGTGKSKRVLAVAVGDPAKDAQDAGADFVMGEEAIEKIQGGWLDFDAIVASPWRPSPFTSSSSPRSRTTRAAWRSWSISTPNQRST